MRYIDNPAIARKYKCRRWQNTRKLKMDSVGGLCERCMKKGKYVVAKIVHHKEYINLNNFVDDDVFYNLDNLEALCQDCHNKEHFEDDDEDYTFDSEGNVVMKKRGGLNG